MLNRITRALTRRLAIAAALLAGLAAPPVWAFELEDLAQQLQATEVVRGRFVQEKHLRALAQPLSSQGRFVLSRSHGLLWSLEQPLTQDYRITPGAIERRIEGQWRPAAQGQAGPHSQLFLQVLRGDTRGLQEQFEPQLDGSAEAWQLRLTPRSRLLQQVFSHIALAGGSRVERIELVETQGDRTLVRLLDQQTDTALSAAEQHELRD
ncbi:outer membrane lipoprotein carrier protein LolA [Stutzerimonas nosocomialis]|uniref:outer membrane lipoprotein carrier protein LolA n=1 Tax=Stutzerimonas nosocomialis TaxID=1056496 RepID=UPI001F4FC41E|nr:outer membrane lipoprotein carrier protein LolA [Stutzerimonas nosocomialis]